MCVCVQCQSSSWWCDRIYFFLLDEWFSYFQFLSSDRMKTKKFIIWYHPDEFFFLIILNLIYITVSACVCVCVVDCQNYWNGCVVCVFGEQIKQIENERQTHDDDDGKKRERESHSRLTDVKLY